MARLPDKSSRLLLISTFIICSLFLFADFRFGIFKPVQNFYNSSSLFIQVFSREYVVNPIFNSFSSIFSCLSVDGEVFIFSICILIDLLDFSSKFLICGISGS